MRNPRPRPIRLSYGLLVMVLLLAVLEVALRGVGAWEEARARQAIQLPAGVGNGWTLVCAGDSVTWGFPGGPDRSYPASLAAAPALAARGTGVVNLGRSGSSAAEATDRMAGFLASAASDRNLVLYLAGFNDCGNVAPRAASLVYREVAGALWGLRTFRLVHHAVRRIDSRPLPPRDVAAGAADDARCTALVEEKARTAADVARRRGRFVVLTYPVPRRPTPGRPESNWLAPRVNEGLVAAATSLGAPLVDVRRCVSEREADHPLTPLFTPDELHLTTAGYAVMAGCVGAGVAELLR